VLLIFWHLIGVSKKKQHVLSEKQDILSIYFMTATELEGGYKLEPTLYSDGGQEIRQLSLMSPISLALCHFSLFPLDSTSLFSRKNGCCQLIKTPKS